MPADIIIPVHNGEPFIYDCISSALELAEITNSNVIVSSNDCTDSTNITLSSFNNARLRVIKTEKFLTAWENYENCLKYSDSEYVISIGSDDKLNICGQLDLFSYFKTAKFKPIILFGYDEIIDIDDEIRRSHEYSRHWKSLTSSKIVRNSFSGHNPNLNGAWVRRDYIDAFIKEFKAFVVEGSFVRVNDLYLWNFICIELLYKKNLPQGYIYIHTPAVFYREYFEFHDVYRSPEIEKNVNQGRIDFIRYSIEKVKYVPNEFQSDCRAGIKLYARNNFINLYNGHDEHAVVELLKELQANSLLGLLERFWLLSSVNKISQRFFLSCIFIRQGYRSFFTNIIQKRKL